MCVISHRPVFGVVLPRVTQGSAANCTYADPSNSSHLSLSDFGRLISCKIVIWHSDHRLRSIHTKHNNYNDKLYIIVLGYVYTTSFAYRWQHCQNDPHSHGSMKTTEKCCIMHARPVVGARARHNRFHKYTFLQDNNYILFSKTRTVKPVFKSLCFQDPKMPLSCKRTAKCNNWKGVV